MSKFVKVLLIVLTCLLISLTGGFFFIKSRPVPAIEISPVNLQSINDGIYTGQYELSPVKVKVRVRVENKAIANIEILEHINGLGKKAEKITQDIIANQSLEVDTISGATYSSRVILKAVEQALTNGKI